LPPYSSALEVLRLNLVLYTGPHLMTAESNFPHLRHCSMSMSSEGIRLSPVHFPMLKEFTSDHSSNKAMLDMSELKMPGLSLSLGRFMGVIKLPVIPLSHLKINLQFFEISSLGFAVQSLESLHVTHIDPMARDFDILVSALSETPAKPRQSLMSVKLRRLTLDRSYGLIPLGAFPALLHLTLRNAKVSLRGSNFSSLISLQAFGGQCSLDGLFPSLRVLSLSNLTLDLHRDFAAPTLQELGFETIGDANLMAISKEKFPDLQTVTLQFCNFFSTRIQPHHIPELFANTERDSVHPVVLKLDRGMMSMVAERTRALGPGWKIFQTGLDVPLLCKGEHVEAETRV